MACNTPVGHKDPMTVRPYVPRSCKNMWSGGTVNSMNFTTPDKPANFSANSTANSSAMNDSEYSDNTAWSYMVTPRRRKNISHRKGSEIGTSRNENLYAVFFSL